VISSEPADLIARVPSLSGTPRLISELPGGLTNRNYKVTTPDGTFVARIWSPGSELLAINREHEYRNTVIAASAGVGAPVIEHLPELGVLVLGYIDGRTYADPDVADRGNIPRIAAACRRLHASGRFVNDFDMFQVQRGYAAVTRSGGLRVPAGYDDLAGKFEAARKALEVRPAPTVPCNNDLIAANFIDDGDRVWLIDYEYSGNNDPCFELGNIANECHVPPDGLAALVTAYYGGARRSRIARAEVQGAVGAYGWTLWAAIQHATSPLDADFWPWVLERFEAAEAGFASPRFDRLLDEMQEAD
jgi:thiamine kinase-like enzyme